MVSDPPLNEKRGFVVDKLVDGNDGDLVTPPCACVPASSAPNSVVVFPVTFPVTPAVDCP